MQGCKEYCPACGDVLHAGWCLECDAHELDLQQAYVKKVIDSAYEEVGQVPIPEAGAIVFRDGKVLLVRSSKAPHPWVFPKGHIEPDESEEECAARETEEEAGVVCLPHKLIGAYNFTRNGYDHDVKLYAASYLGDVDRMEKRTIFWFPIDAAFQVLHFPETKELLRAALGVA